MDSLLIGALLGFALGSSLGAGLMAIMADRQRSQQGIIQQQQIAPGFIPGRYFCAYRRVEGQRGKKRKGWDRKERDRERYFCSPNQIAYTAPGSIKPIIGLSTYPALQRRSEGNTGALRAFMALSNPTQEQIILTIKSILVSMGTDRGNLSANLPLVFQFKLI